MGGPLAAVSELQQGMSFEALQHALSVINEGIAVADPSLPDAPMVYINDAFTRLTGYSREDCIGKNCRFLQGTGTDAAALATLRASLAAQRDCQVELLNYRKDGAPFWNLLSITHVWAPADGGGRGGGEQGAAAGGPAAAAGGRRLRYLIGVQSDVSDLARKAQAAQAARNRFIANMSHELRTPLNGILATAQLLLASALSPEQRELADTILDSSLSLLGTLGDILDFSLLEAAPESDGLALRHEPVCLQQALEGVAEMVAPAAAAKRLELGFLIDPPVLARGPHFWGDATRLRQVLHHLASNAVKYSDRGAVVVRARLAGGGGGGGGGAPGGGGGEALAISVADRGIGMSAELQAGLFQSFRQGSDALNRRYGGTGLGLALSKRLAEAMGGDIFVESEQGEGSTFTLVLRPAWCTDEDAAAGAGGGGGGGEPPARALNSSSGTLSAAGDAPAPGTSSGDLSSSSACGSPPGGGGGGACNGGGGGGGTARGGSLAGSSHLSSISSGDVDGEGCLCACVAAYAHARAALSGTRVALDVAAPLLEEQARQMLAQLGMRPLGATAPAGPLPEGSTQPGEEEQQQQPPPPDLSADMAVVSPCRVAAALRAGWRGRPLVVLGSPDELPERLHPLVVVVGRPLRLGRLVAALQRAAGLASWQGGGAHAPRLGRSPAWAAQQPGAVAGGGHARWRLRASIDNSALRLSPVLAAGGGAAAAAAAAAAAPAPAAGGGAQPPPLDLASTLPASPQPGRSAAGAVLRGLAAVRSALKSGGSGSGSNTSGSRPATPQRQERQRAPDAPVPPDAAAAPPPAPPPPPPRTPAPAPAAAAAGAPSGSYQILIAEDNKVNQMVLCKVLKAVLPGCTPDVVANGLQALEAATARGKAYDLIFMDVHMPEMDGVTASERIRAAPPAGGAARPPPRIVAVTADTLGSLRQRCAAAGIEAFISKPFRVEDLTRVMERFGMLLPAAGGGGGGGGGGGAHAAAPPGLPRPAPAPAPVAG